MCLLAFNTARLSRLLELQKPFALLADDTRVLPRAPFRLPILAVKPVLSALTADQPVRSPLRVCQIVVRETDP